MFTKETKIKIKDYCKIQPEIEACGLIVKQNSIEIVVPAKNIASDKTKKFTINPYDYLRASTLGKVVGFYHSHIGDQSTFSMFDRLSSVLHKLAIICYHLPTDTIYEMSPDENFTLLNRRFEYGNYDCYTLCRDFYRTELGIEFLPFSDYNTLTTEKDLTDLYLKNEFTKYDDLDKIKKFDLLVFKYYLSPIPPHFAVYLGNNYILHHPRNGYSQINKLDESLLKRMRYFLRHRGLS